VNIQGDGIVGHETLREKAREPRTKQAERDEMNRDYFGEWHAPFMD